MDKILLVLALASLAGNIWLAISWNAAQEKALLSDTYAKMLSNLAARHIRATKVITEKEEKIRELEKEVLSTRSMPELVDNLNELFRGDHTASSGKAGGVPDGGSSDST